MARLEILHAVSKFFRECPSAELAEDMTVEALAPLDFFTVKPTAGKLDIVIK